MKLVAVILTRNEERHLPRCLKSLEDLVDQAVVVDCFSTDDTVSVAEELGAKVVQRAWVNYASQFNWALTKLDDDTDWVLRIDASEYLTPGLVLEITEILEGLSQDVDGVICARRMTFQGRLIRFGGVFPFRVLRMFRLGRGKCENHWMGEYIRVEGNIVDIQGELIDDNLNPLSSWIDRHNQHSCRDATYLLNLEYGFMQQDSLMRRHDGSPVHIKEQVYTRMPRGFRAFAYFVYRYVFRFGFLDGKEGTTFHFLQGFWYRYLVDAKVAEVKRFMRVHDCNVQLAIKRVLGIRV